MPLLPRVDERGDPLVEMNALGQDFWAWYSQGDIAQRQLEKLGFSDIGIILYREMLVEQMERVERGEDPIEVYRDPSQNEMIVIPTERIREEDTRSVDRATLVQRQASGNGLDGGRAAVQYVQRRYYPAGDLVRAAQRDAAERVAAGQDLLPEIAPPELRLAPEYHREGVILPGV